MTKPSAFEAFSPIAPTRRAVLIGMGGLLATSLPAAAAEEITMYGWQGYETGLQDLLTSKGVKLNFTPLVNNTEIITRLAASAPGLIDVVTPYMGYLPMLAAAGLLDPIDDSLVPNLQHVHPTFRNDKNLMYEGKRYAVPFTWGSGPLIYRPDILAAAPTSWRDIMKPELEGKVGMIDNIVGNILLASMLTGNLQNPAQITPAQLNNAIDFLIMLKNKHARSVAVSWGELSDSLARGDVVITFNGCELVKQFVADKGKRVEYTYPTEGTYGWVDCCAIARGTKHSAAAHAALDAILAPSSQVAFSVKSTQAIVNMDAIAKLPAQVRFYPYDKLDTLGSFAQFYSMPPLEGANGIAGYSDWQQEYQRFKAA